MAHPLAKKLSRYIDLSPDERDALEALPTRVREYRRGDIIIEQGSSPDESVLLLSGMVMRYRLLPDAARQIVSLHVPGDFVDLHNFLLKPMDHNVGAATNVTVARVKHERLEAVLAQCPRLTRGLMWDMALDAATCREWMVSIGRRAAYESMAHLFCELYFRLRLAGQVSDNSYELRLSQPDIADICGLSAVHVNRSLQALRKDRLIVWEDGRVTIPDIAALQRAAAFDASYLHLISQPELPD